MRNAEGKCKSKQGCSFIAQRNYAYTIHTIFCSTHCQFNCDSDLPEQKSCFKGCHKYFYEVKLYLWPIQPFIVLRVLKRFVKNKPLHHELG